MCYLLFLGRSGHPHGVYSINLIPFSTIWVYLSQNHVPLQIKVINLLGNILVFLPLGVFIAHYIKKVMYRLWLAIGIPFFIESVQVMTFTGVGDIDDVLLNAFGVAIGYCCFACLSKYLIKES
jgi:glycopeptide antibiotics resistance protein